MADGEREDTSAGGAGGSKPVGPRYFEDVLPVELAAINARRRAMGSIATRGPVRPLSPPDDCGPQAARSGVGARRSPDPAKLFEDVARLGGTPTAGDADGPSPVATARAETAAEEAAPHKPDRKRPTPVPCTANGLALSGGGIRSAATCLGAIQALRRDGRLDSIDYLSTVSGGGYTGACLSAAMSKAGGGAYPFGDDVSDSPAIAHLRNYSNYLLPRSRSAVRNAADSAAIVIRGLLANAICVAAFLFPAAIVTIAVYHDRRDLEAAGFGLTLWPAAALVALLLAWAMLRSLPMLDRRTSDTASLLLDIARTLLVLVFLAALLNLQPFALLALDRVMQWPTGWTGFLQWAVGAAVALMGSVSTFASALGNFLKTSERSSAKSTLALRGLTKVALLLAAFALPLLLWLAYLLLSGWAILQWQLLPEAAGLAANVAKGRLLLTYGAISIVSILIMLGLRSNGYSLHRLYRDRLSKAFLFSARSRADSEKLAPPRLRREAEAAGDPPPLDGLKLSALRGSSGPYPLVNAALNVQGSLAANKRGRDADFFMFTPDFVGSDLTMYAATTPDPQLPGAYGIEQVDPRIDLATAMAISGAAVSANMGSSTVRLLSPTLSLLNIRLGYWMKNPRYLERTRTIGGRLRARLANAGDRFFLFMEMFNMLDENRRHLYLTDGGHIENLGLYELLKRGCALIVVIDGEADPEMGFEAFLKAERFARIDLGVRIVLPWEEIARRAPKVAAGIDARDAPRDRGPHCAVGRIFYADGAAGVLVYVKASLSGDEKDYILDYKLRNPDFPHETTGDQFFSEEQFEMYRALGFHMVDGLFHEDRFCFIADKAYGFADAAAALRAIDDLLPAAADPRSDSAKAFSSQVESPGDSENAENKQPA